MKIHRQTHGSRKNTKFRLAGFYVFINLYAEQASFREMVSGSGIVKM